MQIETVWIVLAAVLLVIELWAINRVRKSEGKSNNKGVWIVLIVFVPLFGLIAWAIAGPKHISQNTASHSGR
ncbi:PLDc_N domain-containing protein [Pseudomonas sp. TH08]|uniref:PLD nuclease N-terminal domain-containing protein n=1 Tax=unclassified Pseudomonas TaxID=196821 RepID=UPI001914CA86|nr:MULTISPECIES: PLD nuclease N-terminal domain-containing protein [unclassified Pseudomonas]MBK5529187.1 PLDc_N domain-containing protein [Pseudomonas sp. TH06]MBK5533610.1 PLDc_N domain-containing protein [Pseudomonas sp. TH08]